MHHHCNNNHTKYLPTDIHNYRYRDSTLNSNKQTNTKVTRMAQSTVTLNNASDYQANGLLLDNIGWTNGLSDRVRVRVMGPIQPVSPTHY